MTSCIVADADSKPKLKCALQTQLPCLGGLANANSDGPLFPFFVNLPYYISLRPFHTVGSSLYGISIMHTLYVTGDAYILHPVLASRCQWLAVAVSSLIDTAWARVLGLSDLSGCGIFKLLHTMIDHRQINIKIRRCTPPASAVLLLLLIRGADFGHRITRA